MIKIVYTIGTLLTGGAEVFVVNLIRKLDKTKFEPILIVLDKKNNTFLEDQIEGTGIKVYYINKKEGFSLKSMFKIYNILRKEKPKIIHGNIGGIIYVLLYLLFNKKVRAVHTAHTLAKNEFGEFKRKILKYFYNRKRIIPVVITKGNLGEFISTYKINKDIVSVITNGVDVDKFKVNRNFLNEQIRIGHVGRFEEVKNHKTIALVFESLINKGCNVTLKLVGNGSLYSYYKERLDSNKVTFVKETSQVEEELKNIDIFIFPSLYEGMPLSLIEAMASGCVIVSSNTGGINDLIEDGVNGYKFDCLDVESFVEMIEKLIHNRNKMQEISNNNINNSRMFSLDQMVKTYEDLYKKVV